MKRPLELAPRQGPSTQAPALQIADVTALLHDLNTVDGLLGRSSGVR
jgi:hypothetical protein